MAILKMTINVNVALGLYGFSEGCPKGNWIVDWGDGCVEVNRIDHYYKEPEIYQITVKGDFTIGRLECPSNILSFDKEEDCKITDLEWCFSRCPQLISVPHDWDVSKVTSMESMFEGCISFNQDLSHWNLKEVDTIDMFKYCPIEEKHKPKGLN